jgi:UDP-N-acetylglucosamine 2-epimerase
VNQQIAIIVGTRPEAIKMAPVYLALKKQLGNSVQLISTGQHRELLWPSI